MKKLRLTLDALNVETFDVLDNGSPLRGTVPAHYNTTPDNCPTIPAYCLSDNYTDCNSCQGTCANSCNGTCDGTCPATCGVLCGPTHNANTCPPQCWD